MDYDLSDGYLGFRVKQVHISHVENNLGSFTHGNFGTRVDPGNKIMLSGSYV
jgi:hypothetical protein